MKIFWRIFTGVVILIIIGLLFAGNYFYNYAVVPSKKSFLGGDTPGTAATKESKDRQWLKTATGRIEWHQTADDGLNLRAIYVPAEQTQAKTAIIAHGYMGNAESMASYAKMYHDLGYNVLIPDARGHGKSQGNYIGFGWHERKDYVNWINEVLAKNGKNETITLFGVSMGAATVMMTAGESLPKNVVSIIEDCGYSSVNDELTYQLKALFGLPSFPLMQVTSLITKVRAGYFFDEANAVTQLQKNTIPMFFIHGDKDTFVPFSMLDKVYHATQGPKEEWIVPGAEHAKSFSLNPIRYQEKVKAFLAKY